MTTDQNFADAVELWRAYHAAAPLTRMRVFLRRAMPTRHLTQTDVLRANSAYLKVREGDEETALRRALEAVE